MCCFVIDERLDLWRLAFALGWFRYNFLYIFGQFLLTRQYGQNWISILFVIFQLLFVLFILLIILILIISKHHITDILALYNSICQFRISRFGDLWQSKQNSFEWMIVLFVDFCYQKVDLFLCYLFTIFDLV